MNVRQRIRRLRRYHSIASALARNGLGYVAHDTGLTDKLLFFRGEERRGIKGKSLGERIRMLLEELGPTFVKLGQLASSRPDLLPADIIRELERLQDQVAAFPYDQASAIIEQELGQPVDSLFLRLYETPIAAASIGQVYHACLKDGTDVVVKVQRPNMLRLIETDLGILADWARIAESRLEWARNYRLTDMVEELGLALRAELDYEKEARNAERFAQRNKGVDKCRVPAVYREYSSTKVLTMDYVEGIKLSELGRLDRAGLNRRALAERYGRMIFQQALVEGFFHGDPHPGNVLAQPDGTLAWLDFGMMGRLSPKMKMSFASFVIALRSQNSKGVLRAISRMGIVPEGVDRDRLLADIEELRDKYYKVPFQRLRIGEAVHDLFAVAWRHRISIPRELTLLGKTFLTMEGVVTLLDPGFRIFDIAEPFGRKLFLDRLDPSRWASRWVDDIPEYVELLSEIPAGLKQAVRSLRQGKVKIEVAAPQVDALMAKMDRIGNRLSFSIVLLSLSIIMLGLIVGSAVSHSKTVLWRIPVVEIGLGVAAFMLVWLISSIFRSGRF
ncbi:ABC1 kinase family protein [Cohnella hongkongensis]|uniref:ABC1 kinase family protein n=1 Tax=Cohnella hongkongensis TaxID=178337 RepID=A0ABV9F9G8_9BACL